MYRNSIFACTINCAFFFRYMKIASDCLFYLCTCFLCAEANIISKSDLHIDKYGPIKSSRKPVNVFLSFYLAGCSAQITLCYVVLTPEGATGIRGLPFPVQGRK